MTPDFASPPRTADFDYHLPPELIAQAPAEPRDAARLLVLDRHRGAISHRVFAELDELIRPNDLLVANRTRVLAARLHGSRIGSGGRVEALLLREVADGEWEALLHPGRRLQPGSLIELRRGEQRLVAEVGERLGGGRRTLRVHEGDRRTAGLLALGEAPLPPYIRGWQGDPERYQTVYGDRAGSAAAPTAGLHFTPDLLERLRCRGVGLAFITLHVGPDTFRPMRGDTLAEHEMHSEWVEVPGATLAAIERARAAGGRAIVVGTTTVRALESAAAAEARADSGWSGWTSLFITPGYRFRYLDALITNFHLPRSTLLVLVSAVAGRATILAAYEAAVRERYRFYSFGDAMLIL